MQWTTVRVIEGKELHRNHEKREREKFCAVNLNMNVTTRQQKEANALLGKFNHQVWGEECMYPGMWCTTCSRGFLFREGEVKWRMKNR